MQNKDVLSKGITNISRLLANKDKLLFKTSVKELSQELENSDSEHEEDNIVVLSDEEEDNQISESESNDSEKEVKEKKARKGSVVDDEFFKLNEMENFLNKIEQNENNENDSGK